MMKWIKKYNHVLYLLYVPFYMIVFTMLEKINTSNIHIIYTPMDDKIPFMEIFVIPYLLWFVYMGVLGFYFFFWEKESFIKMMLFEMLGMTAFLMISFVYPNGLNLRPDIFPRKNIFVDLVKLVYYKDTATNVFPSIHVFNSIGIFCTVENSPSLKEKRKIHLFALVITLLIIASTMLIKQHSVIDVFGGIIMAAYSYSLIFSQNPFIIPLKEEIHINHKSI